MSDLTQVTLHTLATELKSLEDRQAIDRER
jgi:hypothetical protein